VVGQLPSPLQLQTISHYRTISDHEGSTFSTFKEISAKTIFRRPLGQASGTMCRLSVVCL